MALHGGGHLELKKMHKGDFWGIFGIRLGRCPCIILEKISFLQFYSRFNPNALALDDVVAVSACINQILTLTNNVHLGNIPQEDIISGIDMHQLIFSMFIRIITL